MDTKTKIGLLIGIIILLIGVVIWGEKRVSNANENAAVYENALEDEKLTAGSKSRLLKNKEDEIYRLKEQNKRLRDSIEVLKNEVGALNKALGSQGRAILANNKKMKEMQMREDSLVKVIGRMLGEESANNGKISGLEKERLSINKDMSELYEKTENLRDSVVYSTVQKEALKEKLSLQETIYEITNNTEVTFKGIYPKRDNGNRARNAKRWKTTHIDLELSHPKEGILNDEMFMVVIRDMNKNIAIPPREANVGKDTPGMTFSFTGNPVKTIRYPNYQEKDSDDYTIQVFYIKNGKQYALTKSGLPKISFKRQK